MSSVDPVVVMNLVMTLIILVLGVWLYESKKEELGLFVGVGFGILAISHALTLLGYGNVDIVIIPIRAIGYLVIIVGICIRLFRVGQAAAVPSSTDTHR